MINYKESFINEHGFPVIWEIKQGTNEKIDNISAWLQDQKEAIDDALHHHGALLLRGFTHLRTASDFEQAITAISPKLMDYVGGTSPRKQVRGNIMTATEIPPKWSIPLHQEMSYTKNPPAYIAFFCVQSAPEGGDSTLGNMRLVTSKIDAKVMEKFQTHGVQLRRSLPSVKTVTKKPGIQKSWEEVLGTTDRGEADVIAKQAHWRTEWLDKDTLQLWQEILPATKIHPVSKAEVWFNQVHMFSPMGTIAWAKRDNREENIAELINARKNYPEMLDTVFYGNGEVVSDEVVNYIFDVLASCEINVKLLTTDLLILDNTLVAHGRTAFSGKREILVALVNTSN